MKNSIAQCLLMCVLALTLNARAAEIAAFSFSNGTVREAFFEIMKDDFIYARIPKLDGSYLKVRFHKSLVTKVVFLNGKELNLTKSTSPPVFNDQEILSFRRLGFNHTTITDPADFRTFQEEIAVRALGASGITESEATALTDVLRGELAKTGRYRVMEREQMVEVLKEQAFQQTGACNEECVVEMGQLLGVKHIVVGNVSKVGKAYSVNVRMVDVATGEIVKDLQEMFRGDKEGLVVNAMPRMARKLSGMYAQKRLGKKFWLSAASATGACAALVTVLIVRGARDGGTGQPETETGGVGIEWGN